MRECEAQGGEGLWNSWPSGGALLLLLLLLRSAAARPRPPPGTRQPRLLRNLVALVATVVGGGGVGSVDRLVVRERHYLLTEHVEIGGMSRGSQ